MIRWLEDDALSLAEQRNMARFKATTFARDLEEDKAKWRFMVWPRVTDTPLRFVLRCEQSREATFTIDAGGIAYGKLGQGA